MNKFKLIIFLLTIVFLTSSAMAKDEEKEIPPWMEDIKVKGRSTYLIPKGAKREIIGAQIIVEPPNEYTARRIYEIEQYIESRLQTIEESHELLKNQFDEIKAALKTADERTTNRVETIEKQIKARMEREAREREEQKKELQEKLLEIQGGEGEEQVVPENGTAQEE